MIVLQHNGNIFIGEEPIPEGVLDNAHMILADPQAGDTITFDGERWMVGKPLLKLAIEDPQDGDVLTYDETAGAWKNVAPTPAEVAPTSAEET